MTNKRYIRQEEWKEVTLPALFQEKYILFISNLGRAKRITKENLNEIIIKLAYTEGYPSGNIGALEKISEKDQQEFIAARKKIAALQKEIKALNEEVLLCTTAELRLELDSKITLTQELFEKIKTRYQTRYKKNERQRRKTFGFLVHRLVAIHFCEKPSEEHNLVAHLDFDKDNNESTNLKWMTRAENVAHQKNSPFVKDSKIKALGRITNAKLTVKQVMILKKRMNEGVSLRVLAKRHAVTETQLLRIKRGENWAKVPAAL
jgi:hypothetical protein